MDSVVKILTLIVGGTIAISLLTDATFGSNAASLGNTFANVLHAMTGGSQAVGPAQPGSQPAG